MRIVTLLILFIMLYLLIYIQGKTNIKRFRTVRNNFASLSLVDNVYRLPKYTQTLRERSKSL